MSSKKRRPPARPAGAGDARLPAISVILPVYNEGAGLLRAIASVRAQRERNWELFVIDDCSTDESCDIAERQAAEDPRIRVIRRAVNGGPAAARNDGLQCARGRWVAYLDGNDEYARGFLSQVVAAGVEGDVLVFGYDLIDERAGQRHFGKRFAWDPQNRRGSLLSGDVGKPLGIVHTRALLAQAGLFNAAMRTHEDVDLWRRFALTGARFAFIGVKSGACHVREPRAGGVRPGGARLPLLPRSKSTALGAGDRLVALSSGEIDPPGASPAGAALPTANSESAAPVVSVVMPVYNGARYFERSIGSVLLQTFSNWELVAVDDCSTDDTFAALQNLARTEPRVRVLQTPVNSGPAAAKNLALRHARGDLIAYLDCDDEFALDHFERIIALENRGDVLVYGYDVFVEERGDALPRFSHTWNTRQYWPQIDEINLCTPLGIVHRRSLLDRAGLFDEQLILGDDSEFWRRFRNLGAEFTFVDRRSGRYYIRPDSFSPQPHRPARHAAAAAGPAAGGAANAIAPPQDKPGGGTRPPIYYADRSAEIAKGVQGGQQRERLRHALRAAGSREALPAVLAEFFPNGRGAEVGVYEGEYSEVLLTGWCPVEFFAVDPWREYPRHEYIDMANAPQPAMDARFRRARDRLSKFAACQIVRKTSFQAAADVPDGHFDFVYIDAAHDYKSVLIDLFSWWPKVRAGGVLAGHDFCSCYRSDLLIEVRQAVSEFFSRVAIQPVGATNDMPPSWFVVKS